MSACVKRIRPSDRDRLRRFFERVEPAFRLDPGSEAWRWLMEDNPANPGGEPQAWLFETPGAGEVAGYLGSIPVALEIQGRPLRAGWTVDLVVLPEYRARGVAPFLYRAWLETVDAGLALGTTPGSLALLKGLGWREVGFLSCYRRVLRTGTYLRERGAGPLAGVLAAPLDALLAPRRPAKGTLERGPLPEGELDALWDRTAGRLGIAARRDRAYVDWRFRRRPGGSYELIAMRKEGRLDAVAVLSERRQRGRRIGLVVDLWGDPDALPALLQHAVLEFRERGADVVHAYALHEALGAALASAGFRPRPSTIRLLYRPGDGAGDPLRDAGADDPGRWWVTLGDSDQDRP